MQDHDEEPPLLVASSDAISDAQDQALATHVNELKIGRVPITIITGMDSIRSATRSQILIVALTAHSQAILELAKARY